MLKKALQRIPANLSKLLLPVAAIGLALLIGAVFIVSVGVNPLLAYQALFRGALGNFYSITEVFVKMTPLLLVSLGYCFCYRMNVIALGGEGQILMGGLASAVVATCCTSLPPLLAILLSLLAACLAGALWASVTALLYTRRKLDIVVNSIMSNYIALLFVTFCINGPFRDPNGYNPQSAQIEEAFRLPILVEGTRFHMGFLIAVLLAFFVYYLMEHTPFGAEAKICGANRLAARYAGIRVERTILTALLLGGALAGLAGGFEIMGIHHRVMGNFSANYGWDAIAVALLGRLNPIAVLLSSFFWAVLKVGANSMQRTVQIPSDLIGVIQALAIFFILASELFEHRNCLCDWFTRRKKEEV